MIKRFSRFELKYVISFEQRDRLLEVVRERTLPDTEFQGSGSYYVSSMYFDTTDLAFYRAKIEGLRYRRKLRIRLYGTEPAAQDPLVMVEIKQRIARTTQKRRFAQPLSQAYALCSGGGEPALIDPRDRAVAEEVDFLSRSLLLRPVCVVGYSRRAFRGGPYDLGLRITFDEALACWPPSSTLIGGRPRHRFLSPTLVVLEVKANDRIPDWVARMLARFDCSLNRYSKYCAAVAAMRERHTLPIAV